MTTDYKMGTPLGPDPNAVADLDAIDTYVREVCRPRIAQFPKSQSLVEDYEKWRQNVSWWDMNVMTNDVMRTAKAKRDAINTAQQSVLPPTSVVEPGSFVTGPPEPKPFNWSWGVAGPGLGMLVGGGLAVYLLWVLSAPKKVVRVAHAVSGGN